MTTHRLKSWPENFRAVLTGRKRHEVRRDDRPYAAGDVVELREFDPEFQNVSDSPQPAQRGFTGRAATYRIGYISRGNGTPPGWCAFELISPEEWARVQVAFDGLADEIRKGG